MRKTPVGTDLSRPRPLVQQWKELRNVYYDRKRDRRGRGCDFITPSKQYEMTARIEERLQ